MGRPAIVKSAPVRSPLRLAESYNPSIVLAGGSSQIAHGGVDNKANQTCWQPLKAARQTVCNGKTAQQPSRRCENTAVLSVRHLADYHPVSSFAVQLSNR